MIAALVQGVLAADPVERRSGDGNRFWTANLRVPAGEETLFISLATFSETAGQRLMQLSKGASIAAAGTLEQQVGTAKDSTARSGWRMTANEVLSLYQARKRPRRDDDEGAR
jgi:single-stranded DNA-binding protein